jgi:hypothetical protein
MHVSVMRLAVQFGPCAGAIRGDGWELKDSHYSEAATTVAFYLFLNEELFLRRSGLIAVPHRTSTGTIPRGSA